MSRAGVLLAGVLAMASVGVLAEKPHGPAMMPLAVAVQTSTSKATQPSHPTTAPNANGSVAAPNPPSQSPDDAQTDSSPAASNELGANRQLPQTSTILPLLGLIGLGSLVAGLFARR